MIPPPLRFSAGSLADPEPSDVRQAALNVVRLTSRKSQEQAIKTLAGMIPRVDPIVLPEVIDCLSTAGPIARVALPSLDKLLDDKEAVTRAAAARAIVTIEQTESPRVLAVMAELIAEKGVPQDWRIEALDMIKQRRSGGPGESLIRPGSPAWRSQRRRPRRGARVALPDHPRHRRRDAGPGREPMRPGAMRPASRRGSCTS